MFCRRIIGVRSALSVREEGKTNGEEKVVERVVKINKDCGKWMRQAYSGMH
jgi:hypothetical protein